MTNDQCSNDETRPNSSFRHLIIGAFEHSFEFRISSFEFPYLDVIHLLLRLPKAIDLLQKLFQRHRVQHLIRGDGQPLADQANGNLAGRIFARGSGLRGGKPAFEPAKQVADGDILGGAGKAIPPAAANFALQETASSEGQENGFEEFIGQPLLFREISGLHEVVRPESSQLDDGAEAIFSAFG